jgi:hypothetical protein
MNNNKETKPESKELFTAGEWEIRFNKIFVKGTNNSIATVSIQEAWDSMARPIQDFQAEANANLLASSKDMFYALQDMINTFVKNESTDDEKDATVCKANAAIQKALGNK